MLHDTTTFQIMQERFFTKNTLFIDRIPVYYAAAGKRKTSGGSRRSQSVKKVFFDRLAEVEGAAKTSKPDPSAYSWYVRVRFAQ